MIGHAHWIILSMQIIRTFTVVFGVALLGRIVAAARRYGFREWTLVAQRRAKFLFALIATITISTFIAVSIVAPPTWASLLQLSFIAIFAYGNVYLDTVVPEKLNEDHT